MIVVKVVVSHSVGMSGTCSPSSHFFMCRPNSSSCGAVIVPLRGGRCPRRPAILLWLAPDDREALLRRKCCLPRRALTAEPHHSRVDFLVTEQLEIPRVEPVDNANRRRRVTRSRQQRARVAAVRPAERAPLRTLRVAAERLEPASTKPEFRERRRQRRVEIVLDLQDLRDGLLAVGPVGEHGRRPEVRDGGVVPPRERAVLQVPLEPGHVLRKGRRVRLVLAPRAGPPAVVARELLVDAGFAE